MDYENKIIQSFNKYDGSNPEVLDDLYDKNVVFEDPLTKTKGLKKLKEYYAHAYDPVSFIKFDFKKIHKAGLVYTCEWDMTLKASVLNFGRKYTVRGVSIITFSEESQKVIKHHDYVDIGDMVYERIPAVGSIVKQIKKRLSN